MKLPLEVRLIDGTECYFAGSDGHIYSFNNRRGHHPRKLKGAVDRHGYRFVNFFRFGEMKSRKVHALICEAFHGPKPEGCVTRHLDGVRSNNVPENLCWGTPKENAEDTARHGNTIRGERSPIHKLSEAQTVEIKARAAAGEKGTRLAAEFGVTSGAVYHIIHGRAWNHVQVREVLP